MVVLREFGMYLLSFLGKWLFWIGTAVLIGDLFEKKWPKLHAFLKNKAPYWMLTVLAVLCFSLASFQVWQEEYEKTHPGLHLTLDEWGFAEGMEGLTANGNVPLLNNKGTPAVIIASISNLGTPSIAHDWKLYIRVPGRKETIEPRLVDFNSTGPFTFDGKDPVPLDKLLYKETITPITSGDRKRGIIVFFADGISEKELAQKGTAITLTCRDVADNEIKSPTVKLGGHNEGHSHFYDLE